MGSLLFSPSGRIGPSQFMKGYMIVILISLVIGLLPAVMPALAVVAIPISLALLWMTIVLWVKRYHDCGKTGWMCLIPIVVGIIASVILSAVLTPMFVDADAAAAAAEAAAEAAEAGDVGGAFSAAMGASGLSTVGTIILSVAGAVLSYVIALVFNNMIKHDAHDNQYGPEAGSV